MTLKKRIAVSLSAKKAIIEVYRANNQRQLAKHFNFPKKLRNI